MTDATVYYHQDLSVDQQLALRTAAVRLAREFDGTYGAETIERFLRTSYDQFANLSLRDEIERRVRRLIDQLGVPAA